jgi:hypothetical protein
VTVTSTLRATREATRAPAPVGRISLPRPRQSGILRPLAIFAASRVLVLATVAVVAYAGRADPGGGPWPTLPGPRLAFLRALGRWDAAWYVAIAHHGYRVEMSPPGGQASDAFFPVFPMLIKLFSVPLHVSPLIVGLILSTVIGAGAALAVWFLARRLAGPAVADRAVTLFSVFPGAFVLSMAYAEGLLVLACATCLLALHDRRWVVAGVAAAVATATRPNAAPIVLACVAAAVVATRRRREFRSWVAPALAPLGAAAFFISLWVRTGSITRWFDVERTMWRDHLDVGFTALHRVGQALTGPAPSLAPGGLNIQAVAVGVLLAVVGIAFVIRWRPPLPIVLFTLAAVLTACASVNVGPRPRLLMAAFPVAIATGKYMRGRLFVAVVTVSAAGMVALTALTVGSLSVTP